MVETVIGPGEPSVNGITHDATGLVEQLAERLGAQARASTIYGEPIDRDGVTIIPVARAIWGFGGGAGRDEEQQVGSGGGGGMMVSPVGYIEISEGGSTYRPIFKPPVVALAAVVGMALGLLMSRVCGAVSRMWCRGAAA
jgi:uncharacterized spore protein YtfJ